MIRHPAVAGTFYPAEPETLRRSLERMVAATPAQEPVSPIKALIVPHAGYIYSGEVAGSAYARLASQADAIERVILLGPVHRVPVRGLALPDSDSFATPLGDIPLDQNAIAQLQHLPQVVTSGAAHAQEHSLEVQLPFLQAVLGRFSLVPLAVGDASARDVAEVLETLWGGPETLIVVSSDLSHYLPYAEAGRRDRDTVDRVLHGSLLESHQQACGATPINGLLLTAGKHGLEPNLVSLCNSGDTAGDRDHVVGYAAITFAEREGQARADEEERGEVLLGLARAAISSALGRPQPADRSAPWLQEQGATFVTLTRNGKLRGCVGSVEAHDTLLRDIEYNARAAALQDTRFPPLAEEELDNTRIEVSLLSPLEPIAVHSESDTLAQLRPGVDGVVLAYRNRRGTFLPKVWEDLPEPRAFLENLKLKAGLPPDFWSDDIRLYRYHVTSWSEPESRPRMQ